MHKSTNLDIETIVQICIDNEILIQDKKNNIVLWTAAGIHVIPIDEFIHLLKRNIKKQEQLVHLLEICEYLWKCPSPLQPAIEFSDETTERINEINNAISQAILVLVGKSQAYLPLNPELVHTCTIALIHTLNSHNVQVTNPIVNYGD